jgi:hypothetical protein
VITRTRSRLLPQKHMRLVGSFINSETISPAMPTRTAVPAFYSPPQMRFPKRTQKVQQATRVLPRPARITQPSLTHLRSRAAS